jgi:hypothetical protein
MNRLSPCLLGILLAAWGTACVTKEGPTKPDTPASAAPPTRWTGTATFTNETEYANGSAKDQFELQVTWVKAENPNPAPPPGTTRYVPSGSVHAHIQSNVDLGGTCTVDREGSFPIAVSDEPVNQGDQVLDVAADGQYQGKLRGGWLLEYVQFCPARAFQQRRMVRVALDIQGTLDGGRMHGSMPPYVVTIPSSLTSTSTGSWSFSAN